MLRRALATSGLALAAAAIGVIAIEALLRAAGIAYPDFFRDDPVLGRSLRPGAHGWWKIEGTAYVEINADGMRDRERAIPKPPGTLRIALLGDDSVAAFGVSEEDALGAELERELGGCPALEDRSVEVLNFGLGGAGTAQELLILQHRVWKYEPDVVLLAFSTGDDVSDNSRALKGSGRAPYFVYDARGALVLDPLFVEKRGRVRVGLLADLWQALFNRSRLLQVASEGRRRLKALTRAKERAANAAPGSEAGSEAQIYAPPTHPEWVRAWAVTEDLVRAIAAEVRARGAGLLVATLTNGIQVHPDVGVRERFAAQLGAPDLLYPDRRIEALARAEGVAFHMLAPPLAAWAAEHQICIHGFENATPCDGHWNEHGHRLAAEELAAVLCRHVLPARAAAPARIR